MTNPNLSREQVRALDDLDLGVLARSLTPTGKLAETLVLVRDEINRRNGPAPGTVVVEYYTPEGRLYHAQPAPTPIAAGHMVVEAIGTGTVMVPQGAVIHFREARDRHHKRPVVLTEGERQAIREALFLPSAVNNPPPGVSIADRRTFLDAIRAKLAD
jgi:hypothetical protein